MTTSIKITELSDIGANIAYTTLLPVVNMAGTPITERANVLILGNLILEGAGTGFSKAALATIAQSVSNAAQPNITSVGTLTSLLVTGNITMGNATTTGTVTATTFTGNTNGYTLGYLYSPQRLLTTSTTTVVADTGKHYYSTQSADFSVTVANVATQPFVVGSQIEIINGGTGNVDVVADTGVILYAAGNGTAGTRIVTSFGVAKLTKVASDTWIISGQGVVSP